MVFQGPANINAQTLNDRFDQLLNNRAVTRREEETLMIAVKDAVEVDAWSMFASRRVGVTISMVRKERKLGFFSFCHPMRLPVDLEVEVRTNGSDDDVGVACVFNPIDCLVIPTKAPWGSTLR